MYTCTQNARTTVPKDLNGMLPPPLERRRVTRASTSTRDHAVSLPTAKTHQLDRSFIHTASRVWNSLPYHVVGTLSCTGLNSFKRCAHRFLLANGIPRLQYRKSGWLWTSKENHIFHFIISYCLSFSRLFSYILLRQYINIINYYNLLVWYVFHVFFWNTLKSVNFEWSNFPKLVEKNN